MYLLDSNVFIEAHRRFYGIDFVPGSRDWLRLGHAADKPSSIDVVAEGWARREGLRRCINGAVSARSIV